MKRVILNYIRCQNSGELGLILDGVSHHNVDAATDGTLVAHDVIDHNGASTIGGVCDELEALGSLWWIRGSLSDIRRDRAGSVYTPHENIAADISHLAESYIHNDIGLDLPIPKNKACIYDDDFKEIIEIGKSNFNKEISYHSDCTDIAGNCSIKSYFANSIYFMRSGYRKAKYRYQRLDQYRVNSLFWNIAEAVDSAFKYMDYEGQQLELRYCLTTTKTSIDFIEPDYY